MILESIGVYALASWIFGGGKSDEQKRLEERNRQLEFELKNRRNQELAAHRQKQAAIADGNRKMRNELALRKTYADNNNFHVFNGYSEQCGCGLMKRDYRDQFLHQLYPACCPLYKGDK